MSKKLTYWIAFHPDDDRYNERGHTRRDVVEKLRDDKRYSKPVKITITYRDALNLINECLGEGGGLWEEQKAATAWRDAAGSEADHDKDEE